MKSMAIIVIVVLLSYLTASVTTAPLADQQQQSDSTVNVDQLIEEVKTTASEVGTASYVLYKYIDEELLSKDQGSPQAPCFIRERTQAELDPSPRTNYTQLLLENYQSAQNYVDYIRRVEEQYNDTIIANPGCQYCTRFSDTKRKMEQLLTKLDTLVEAVNLTTSLQSSDTPSQSQGGDTAPEDEANEDPTTTTTSSTTTTSEGDGLPDYCSNLCPEQQVDIFMRLDIFASVYVQLDLSGLLEQLKGN